MAQTVPARLDPEDLDTAFAILRIDSIFRKDDKDRNKSLDAQELPNAFHELWIPFTEEQIDSLVAKAKFKGGLTIDEFERFVLGMEHQYSALFRKLDKNGNGVISKDEMRKGMELLEFKVSDEEMESKWLDCLKLPNPTRTAQHSRPCSQTQGSVQNPDAQLSYIQWRQAIIQVFPEARQWSNEMFNSQLQSADMNGENIRPRRLHGDPVWLDLTAGFISGCVSRTITAPGDRIKTEMQLLPAGKQMSAMYDLVGS